MKKNIVIVVLAIIAGCFAYLGIKERNEKIELEVELFHTQKALYSVGKNLEEYQYLDEWTNDPSEGKSGIYKFRDYYDYSWHADEYRMRVNDYGIDIPLWFNNNKKAARVADSYEGFEWDKVLIEFK